MTKEIEEIWKDVIGSDGKYQVSNLGRVKSLVRKGKIKATGTAYGYTTVGLNINKKSTNRFLHVVLAESFINADYIEEGLVVNHKDGIKTNNNLSNIELVSYSENLLHAYRNGLNKNIGENHTSAKFSTETINKAKEYFANGHKARYVSEKLGISVRHARDISYGKARKTG